MASNARGPPGEEIDEQSHSKARNLHDHHQCDDASEDDERLGHLPLDREPNAAGRFVRRQICGISSG